MPDEELFQLAARANCARNAQTSRRMLKDRKRRRSCGIFRQWLRPDIETVPINARAVLGFADTRGNPVVPRRLRRTDAEGDARGDRDWCSITLLREDRSVLEFIESDYTFLNAKPPMHYGIRCSEGDEMRRVTLRPAVRAAVF